MDLHHGDLVPVVLDPRFFMGLRAFPHCEGIGSLLHFLVSLNVVSGSEKKGGQASWSFSSRAPTVRSWASVRAELERALNAVCL